MRRELFLTVGLLAAFAAPASALEVFRSPCPDGSSYPVTAANGSGDVLVSWQQTRVEGDCKRSVAEAALGSPATGFAHLGAVPARGLSLPTSVFLDDAGDGWIMGTHEHVIGSKYGPEFGKSGAWYAFRHSSGRLRRAVELVPGGASASALVAGNRFGRVVLAWSTEAGTHLAWGTPTGRVSRQVFYGHGFQFTGVGVDDQGRALISGYYPGPGAGSQAREIAVITGHGGSFSRPRSLAVRPRDPRGRRRVGGLGLPVMASGVHGQAVIAWESLADPENGLSRDMLAYRRADRHFNRPMVFATGFLDLPSPLAEPNMTVMDGSGRALLIQLNRAGLEVIAVDPAGRPTAPRNILRGRLGQPSLAGNPAGMAIVTWSELQGGGGISFVSGTTQGLNGPPQTILSAPGTADGNPSAALGTLPPASLFWDHGTGSGPDTLLAGSSAPGAQELQITSPAGP